MSEPPECDGHLHIWEVEEPVTETPPERRCLCAAHSWGEMDALLLETIWNQPAGPKARLGGAS